MCVWIVSFVLWGHETKSISIGAQYVTLDSKIKMSKFSSFFWATPPMKLELQIHGGLLIANHLDQSEILSRSQVQFITLFSGSAQLCCTFHQPRQAARIGHSEPAPTSAPSRMDDM